MVEVVRSGETFVVEVVRSGETFVVEVVLNCFYFLSDEICEICDKICCILVNSRLEDLQKPQ